jgi:hypothetical protein
MLEAAGRLRRTTMMLPSPAAGEILVATTLGAVSPGTERSLLHGTCPSSPPSAYPCQPGYLNVVSIEDAQDRTLLHERGIARLGHRDHALIPYPRFIRIPPGVEDEAALLGVLAADARHAIDIAAPDSGADCLVIGGGVMGALAAWELCSRTKGTVRLVERDGTRRELLGAVRFPRDVAVADSAGRQLFDVVFDCASTSSAFLVAQQSARPRGSIVLIADGSHEAYTLAPEFFAKGLFLGKTDSHPDLRGFLGDFFARREDRSSLISVAFRQEIRFADFPQSYLEALLSPGGGRGLLPRVRYGD